MGLFPKIAWLIFVGMLCVECTTPAVLAEEARQDTTHAPLMFSLNRGVTKGRYAAVRSAPDDKAALVGYIPGAIPVGVFPDQPVKGWLKVGINWRYKGEQWVRREDIALEPDYRYYTGAWPLEYLVIIMEGLVEVQVYPTGNRCPEQLSDKEVQRISQEVNVSITDIRCVELWHVPGTNILHGNYTKLPRLDTDIWYDRNLDRVFYYFESVDILLYKYRNGLLVRQINSCRPENKMGVSCELSGRRAPPKTPPAYPPPYPELEPLAPQAPKAR